MSEGSDINVGSIEEDIKILENLKSYLNLLAYEGKDKIIYNDLLWDEKTVDCINAIEHLINDYTRQKQINEEHQKINGKLRERVKELDTENNKLLKELYNAHCIISDLSNKVKELEQEIEKINKQLDLDYVEENYIPTQVVIDKIEELKKLKTALPVEHLKEAQIKILQELLERKK